MLKCSLKQLPAFNTSVRIAEENETFSRREVTYDANT